MASAEKISSNIRSYLRENISFLFVDEAHHSKAQTWDSFIGVFPKKRVIMFTATPFRNDGQKLNGKIIFNYSLKKAQEQGYYQKINNYFYLFAIKKEYQTIISIYFMFMINYLFVFSFFYNYWKTKEELKNINGIKYNEH